MQKIKFVIRPYRSSDNTINPGWVRLCLTTESGEEVASQDISRDAWATDAHECRAYWKHMLLTYLKDKLKGESNAQRVYIQYCIDDDIYEEWYRWYYYIDGENAYDYIRRCPASQHTTNWQARCGVTVGWKFYKKLISHNFREDTAAMLAYARGYLTGMETNSPFAHEGFEALECLGLSIEGDWDALAAS